MTGRRSMTVRHLLLGAVTALSFGLLHAPAQAAASGACDRACLNDVVEKYLAAMAAHNPAKGPIAKTVRYTENGQEMKLPDGLWKITTSIEPYRLIIADP